MQSQSPIKRPRFLSRRALKLLIVDGTGVALSLTFAVLIRFDFQPPEVDIGDLLQLLGGVVFIKLLLFYCFRQFHILPDFFSIPDLRRLVLANGYASVVVILVGWKDLIGYQPPRGVLAIDFLLCLVAITGVRLGLRLRRERMRQNPVN